MKTLEVPSFENTRAEQCLLSSILLDNEIIYDVMDKISPEHFSNKEHSDIYSVMLKMHEKGKGIDFATLKDINVDSEYIEQLASILTTSMHVKDYIDSILESYVKREYTNISLSIIDKASNCTAEELMLSAESEILEAKNFCNKNETTHVLNDIVELQQEIAENIAKPSNQKVSLGILTGIVAIDKYLMGLRPGKVYILAGRPGVGKSSFITTATNNICVKKKIPTVIYSIEMSKRELLYRSVSTGTQIPCSRIELGMLSEEEQVKVFEYSSEVSNSPLYLNEAEEITINSIKSDLRKVIKKYGAKIAFIDYLGLIDGDGKDNYHKISKISNEIRKVAKALNIPIVLLCQMNRESEKRGQKSYEPTLADLRDSGAIEQDAYAVVFIDRPEMREPDNPAFKGKALFKTAKHRGGKTGKAEVDYIGECYTFKDID